MQNFTQKKYKEEFKEIQKYFNLPFIGSIDNKNTIDTKWGKYNFYFDKDSILGKFEDFKKELVPPGFSIIKGVMYKIEIYPNLNNGKMNFHFYQVFEFINTMDRILV